MPQEYLKPFEFEEEEDTPLEKPMFYFSEKTHESGPSIAAAIWAIIKNNDNQIQRDGRYMWW